MTKQKSIIYCLDQESSDEKENNSKKLNEFSNLKDKLTVPIYNIDDCTDTEDVDKYDKLPTRKKNTLNIEKNKIERSNHSTKSNVKCESHKSDLEENFENILDDSFTTDDEPEIQNSVKKSNNVKKSLKNVIDSDTSSCASPTKIVRGSLHKELDRTKNTSIDSTEELIHRLNGSTENTVNVDTNLNLKPLGFNNELEQWIEETNTNPLISSSSLAVSITLTIH